MDSFPIQSSASSVPLPEVQRPTGAELTKRIQSCLEWYFGDVNLSKDRFLRQKILESQEGFVPLETLLTFNKLKSLTSDVADLRRAIRRSSHLTLRRDGHHVRRVTPLSAALSAPLAAQSRLPLPSSASSSSSSFATALTDTDARTVYVEFIPADSTHESLSAIFSRVGKVLYISLPRHESTHSVKGFAFVEFEARDQAARALKELNAYVSPFSSLTPAAEQDALIAKDDSKDKIPAGNASNSKKIVFDDDEEEEEENDEDDEHVDESEEEKGENEEKTSNDDEEIELMDDHLGKKKMDDHEATSSASPGEESRPQESQTPALRVVSKADWMHLRRLYTLLQRRISAEDAQRNPQNNQQNQRLKPSSNFSRPPSGAVVRIENVSPQLRSRPALLRQFSSKYCIAHVDHVQGTSDAHLRFQSPEEAARFVREQGTQVEMGQDAAQVKLLSGDEENQYWQFALKSMAAVHNRNVIPRRPAVASVSSWYSSSSSASAEDAVADGAKLNRKQRRALQFGRQLPEQAAAGEGEEKKQVASEAMELEQEEKEGTNPGNVEVEDAPARAASNSRQKRRMDERIHDPELNIGRAEAPKRKFKGKGFSTKNSVHVRFDEEEE